jgi:putative PIN family toxin of toxin-antitoxin system
MGEEAPVLKVVLDTNVLVSALLFRGRLATFVQFWQRGEIIPVISRETFEEFRTVLEYPKFSLAEEEIGAIIEDEVLPFFEVTDIADPVEGICRDPHDDKFLAAAVNGGASFLVTGDRDLLELKRFRTVEIILPQDFIGRVHGGEM